jgi:hypothetical protein
LKVINVPILNGSRRPPPRERGVTEGAVDEVLDQRADAMLSGKHQRRALMLQLARLDELIEVFTRRPWAATRFAAHCA